MDYKITLDINEAHQYFSVEYFNQTQEYIERTDPRTPEENMTMLHTAIASLWHWTQREDARAEDLSMAYWQVSRVYNLIGQPHNARTYGLLSLEHAHGLEPFHEARAYETLARAEMQTNNRVIMKFYLETAYQVVEQITSVEDKESLLKDLASIH
jgi:hypothetical protein